MLTEYPDIVSQSKFIKDIAPEMCLKTLQNQISQGLIPVKKIGKKTYINMYAIKKALRNDFRENELFLKKVLGQ